MAGAEKKWLIGCGVGCGALVLLGILISVGGGLYMMRPFNKAIKAQKALVAEFGEREAFVPGPQGVTPDRLEAFIAVRRAVMPMCEEFRKIGDSFAAMDELDKDGQGPTSGETFKAVGNLTGGIFGMVGNMGRFNELRNQALLEQGMSLGEYIWIYVLVYNSWLGHAPSVDFDGESGGSMSAGERRVVQTLVRNHAEALAAAGRAEEAALWEKEAARMNRTETGVPFPDGDLPPARARDFLPYESVLESLYCEAMSGFEMNQVKKKGLSIHTD